MDCNPQDSFFHRIFKAGILEQVAIFNSRESSQPRDQIHISCISWIGWWIFYCCTKDFRYHISYKERSNSYVLTPIFIFWAFHLICVINGFCTSKCRLRLRLCVCQAASVVSNSENPWTVGHQAPLSMGFSRQEYWSGLLFPSPVIKSKWS